ncbi:magnesium transporter CorA family protein [Actinocorallia longicatena]|uniref:Magnesium transporter CorA family protein n=1 Tax=Actinocorallia longicatena TaxID=111803 RepID=A0ABP6Q215_9ACTN
MGIVRTRAWQGGRLSDRDFDIAQVSEHIDAGALVWVDLCDYDEADVKLMADELGLDDLAVEDALSEHERAKLDRYAGYLFLNVYATELVKGELRAYEISAFVTGNALVTVRRGDARLAADELEARWDPEMTEHGVSYLLHGFLDQIVDQHFTAIQELDDEVEALEDLLFEEAKDDRALQHRAFQLRRSLVLLRRVVLPMREIVNTLLRRDLKLVPDTLAPYYQDVYDHTLRATEWTEGLRDLVANVMDTRIALHGNQMNEAMKKVTSWAAIIAIPTAVTGFYGMNVPYPGYDQSWGFWTSIAVLAFSSITLYAVFKKHDWL